MYFGAVAVLGTAVPEAAVDEHHDLRSGEHDVAASISVMVQDAIRWSALSAERVKDRRKDGSHDPGVASSCPFRCRRSA